MAKRSATTELNQDNWNCEEEPEERGEFKRASDREMATRAIRKAKRRIGDTKSSPVFSGFSGFNVESNAASKPMFGLDTANKSSFSAPMFSFGNNAEKDKPTLPTFSFTADPSTASTDNKFTFAKKIDDKVASPVSGDKKVAETTEKSTQPPPMFSFGSNNNSNTDKNTKSFNFTFSNKSPMKSQTEQPAKVASNINGTDKEEKDESDKSYLVNLKALNLGVTKWIKEHVEKNPYVNLEPVFKDYLDHYKEIGEKYGWKEILEASSEKSENSVVKDFSFNSAAYSSNSSSKSDKASKPDEKKDFVFGSDQNYNSCTVTSHRNTLSFSAGSAKVSESGSSTSSGFSFGNISSFSENKKSGFTFSNIGSGSATEAIKTTPQVSKDSEEQDVNASEEPPKVEEVELKEENSFYEKKVKLYYKKDGSYVDRGVGMLFMKNVSEKTQLIIRNTCSKQGTILLNIILSSSLPVQRLGKKDVLVVCVPNPPIDSSNTPVSMLIRVKTEDDANELFEKINENKN